jgi:ceramide glucosyltransferase
VTKTGLPLKPLPRLQRESTRAAATYGNNGALVIHPPAKIFLILGTLLALQGLWSLLDSRRFLRLVRRSLERPPGGYQPPATVIIPCKGLDSGFDLNVSRFLAQRYTAYQLILVVASEEDLAYRHLAERLARPSEAKPGALKTALVVAGHSETRGEKVNNLLRGVRAADPGTEVLVFADADATPGEDWLRSLVEPLADPRVTVSTGFRWYLPGETFASQLRAAWDTSIATLLGEHRRNFAWGGSMAIRAADFRRLQVAERYWASTISDDFALTRAVREAHGWIRFEPRCLLKSREDSSLREFLRWANRQIIITRVYSAHLWWVGLGFYLLYGATFLWGLVLTALPSSSTAERLAAAGILLALLALGMGKGYIRTLVARETFPEERLTLKRYGSRYWQLAPLVPWVMLPNFLIAAFARRLEWRGIAYELRSRDEVRVLKD